MQAMVQDLQNYYLDEIERAFKIWRQSTSKIPTPADIISLIAKERRWNADNHTDKPLMAQVQQKVMPTEQEKATVREIVAELERRAAADQKPIKPTQFLPVQFFTGNEIKEGDRLTFLSGPLGTVEVVRLGPLLKTPSEPACLGRSSCK